MKKFSALVSVIFMTFAGAYFAEPASAAESITFNVDAPWVQGTYVQDAVLENFNANSGSACPTQLAFGTYTGTCENASPIYYAGASSELSTPVTGGDATPFAQVPMGSSMDITLDHPAQYLGFHWEAGNQYDRVQLYNGETLIADFSFQTLMDALQNSTLSASGGTVYQESDYIGNPVSGVQAEPYAYVHIFASSGAKFNRVIMSEDAGSPGIFEFDNMAIGYAAATAPDTLVPLGSVNVPTQSSGGHLASTGSDLVPLTISGVLLAGVGVLLIRRPKKNSR